MSEIMEDNLLPGLEAAPIKGIIWKSLSLSTLISVSLFGLLPLSEFVREDQWLVRDALSPNLPPPPPPPPTEVEKIITKIKQTSLQTPKLEQKAIALETSPMEISLDVTPGDFKAAFSIASFNPAPDGFGKELVFSLHELDRNPSIMRPGKLIYPPHLKRRGLEGEVKLLIQIDEIGKVKVLEIVSSSHPDFIDASKSAAESSVYEAPMRNGEKVKTQFYLPIRFSLLQN